MLTPKRVLQGWCGGPSEVGVRGRWGGKDLLQGCKADPLEVAGRGTKATKPELLGSDFGASEEAKWSLEGGKAEHQSLLSGACGLRQWGC
jgi:hypothetical protein